jgi:hypothetical protein
LVKRQANLHFVWLDEIYESVKSDLGPRQWRVYSQDSANGSDCWTPVEDEVERCRQTRLEFTSILERKRNGRVGGALHQQQQQHDQHSTGCTIVPTAADVCFGIAHLDHPGSEKYRNCMQLLAARRNSAVWSDALNQSLQRGIQGRFLIDKGGGCWRLAKDGEINKTAASCYKRYWKLNKDKEKVAKKKAGVKRPSPKCTASMQDKKPADNRAPRKVILKKSKVTKKRADREDNNPTAATLRRTAPAAAAAVPPAAVDNGAEDIGNLFDTFVSDLRAKKKAAVNSEDDDVCAKGLKMKQFITHFESGRTKIGL